MVKSELKNGNFLKLKNGEIVLVCNEHNCEKYVVYLNQEKIILLDENYNENLQSYNSEEEDVVEVYGIYTFLNK